MSKIQVNRVAEILKKHKIEPALLREIVEELNEASQPVASSNAAFDAEPVERVKKQFVVLVSDPDGTIPRHDLVGWVLCIPEDHNPHNVTSKIDIAAANYNATKRGRLHPVHTVGEALETVKAGIFRDIDLYVKTKSPIAFAFTKNKLRELS